MRSLILVVLSLMLAACGGSRESRAVSVCETGIKAKLAGKEFSLNHADMLAKAKADGGDVINIQSVVVFDKGLPKEYEQTFECKARFTDGKSEPDLISLSFTW